MIAAVLLTFADTVRLPETVAPSFGTVIDDLEMLEVANELEGIALTMLRVTIACTAPAAISARQVTRLNACPKLRFLFRGCQTLRLVTGYLSGKAH